MSKLGFLETAKTTIHKDRTLQRLLFLSLGIGVAGCAGIYYIQHNTIKNIQSEPYFKATLQIFDGYTYGKKIVGEPYKLISNRYYLNRDLNFSFHEGNGVKIAIPIKGENKLAMLHSISSRDSEKDSWVVDKVDLQIEALMWTFYIHPDKVNKYMKTEDMTTEQYKQETGLSPTKKETTEQKQDSSEKEESPELKKRKSLYSDT